MRNLSLALIIAMSAGTTLAQNTQPGTSSPPRTNPPATMNPGDAVNRDTIADSMQLIRGRQIVGQSIALGDGRETARVVDVLIGNSSGRIDYVVVIPPGSTSATNRVAIPYNSLTWNAQKSSYSLPAGIDLSTAPTLRGEDWNYLSEDATRRSLHDHFRSTNTDPVTDPDRPSTWSADNARTHPYFRLSDLQKHQISAADGRNASFQDVVIDPATGRVIFAGVKFDQMDRTLPLPWYSMGVNDQGRLTAQQFNNEKLGNAPSFNDRDWAELKDRNYTNRVYQHYGMSPSWMNKTNNTNPGRDQNNRPGTTNPNPRPTNPGTTTPGTTNPGSGGSGGTGGGGDSPR